MHIANVQASVYSGRAVDLFAYIQVFAGEVLGVVANNRKCGRSNVCWPEGKDYVRKVIHVHGQLQAVIAFLVMRHQCVR